MKTSLTALPLLKKRLRRIQSIGLDNLPVEKYEFEIFFTLHENEKSNAFYNSESIEDERNPSWRNFRFPTEFQSLQEFHLIVWMKCKKSDEPKLLIRYAINLQQCLVADVQKNQINSTSLCLWLEIFGHRFSDSPASEIDSTVDQRTVPIVKSYNRPTLLRILNVIDTIEMERKAARNSRKQAEQLFQNQREFLFKLKQRESRKARIECLREQLTHQKEIFEKRTISLNQRRKILEIRRRQHALSLLNFSKQQSYLQSVRQRLEESKSTLARMKVCLVCRQKFLIGEVAEFIYPIEMDKTNELTIAGLKLSIGDDKSYESISYRDKEKIAAIEFVAHFLLIISRLTFFPLRYPIERESSSPIRIFDKSFHAKEFLLDPSVDLQSFQCAFLLLNRNLIQLIQHFRVTKRRLDFRRTLENLKMFIDFFLYHRTARLKKEPNEILSS